MAERKGFKAVDSRGPGAMTTDNRTNEPTPEQIVSEALGTYGLIGRARDLAARNAVEQLRAHGLLSEGTPTETKWVCGKCSREQARGHDDGQIPEHHRTCPKRTEAKQPEDWSTEELDKVTLDRLQELAEERGYDKGFAAGWKSEGRTADLLAPKLRKAQAERDAALAAIERVRAEADAYAKQPDVMEPCGAVAQALRTALDEAPEPETPELFPGTNAALDRLTVRKAAPAEAFCIEHGNFHAVELGDPTCEFEDGFGEPVDGEKP